jgi:hypothetical protein
MNTYQQKMTLEEEVRALDMMSPAQRKMYLGVVEYARGLDVALTLRAALVALWKSFR